LITLRSCLLVHNQNYSDIGLKEDWSPNPIDNINAFAQAELIEIVLVEPQ